MNRTTKPKGIGIAATMLLATLLIAVVSAPAMGTGEFAKFDRFSIEHHMLKVSASGKQKANLQISSVTNCSDLITGG